MRGRAGGSWGGGDTTGGHRRAASRQNGRGMRVGRGGGGSSQPACPPPAAGAAGAAARLPPARCLQPVLPAAAPLGSVPLRLPHRALPGPGRQPVPGPGRQAELPGWRLAETCVCVCVSVPPGLSAPSGKRGARGPPAPPLFCGAGKGCGAKQTQTGEICHSPL